MDFRKQLKFVSELIDNFDIGPNATRVGVSSFSTRYHENIAVGTYANKEDIKKAIGKIPHYTGDTYTYDALDGVRTRAFKEGVVRPGVKKIVIVLTDGASYNAELTREAAKQLKVCTDNLRQSQCSLYNYIKMSS